MLAIRLFLGFSALLWLPYGIYCFLQPNSLTEAAGPAVWLLGRSGSVVHAPAD